MADEDDDVVDPPVTPEPPEPPAPVDWNLTADEKAQFLRDLKEAYYLGANRVKFRERDVSYRNRADMKAIIDELESELAVGRRRKQVILTTFGRGY